MRRVAVTWLISVQPMHRELTPITRIPKDWIDIGFFYAVAVDANEGPYGVAKVTHENIQHRLWRGMMMQPNCARSFKPGNRPPSRAITYMAYGPVDELIGRSLDPMEMWRLLPHLHGSWALHGETIDGIMMKLASARHIQKQALIDIANEER